MDRDCNGIDQILDATVIASATRKVVADLYAACARGAYTQQNLVVVRSPKHA